MAAVLLLANCLPRFKQSKVYLSCLSLRLRQRSTPQPPSLRRVDQKDLVTPYVGRRRSTILLNALREHGLDTENLSDLSRESISSFIAGHRHCAGLFVLVHRGCVGAVKQTGEARMRITDHPAGDGR